MNIKFKTIEFHNKYLDDDVLNIVEIDSNLRAKNKYIYLNATNDYFESKKFRDSQTNDIYGYIIILAYIDEKEVGAISCYRLKDKYLFIDKIEIIEKRKGYGTLIFNELKKYFNRIKIEQAIPEAMKFYEKLDFEYYTIYAAMKFPTMYWKS